MCFPTSKIASGEDITAGFRVPLVKQRNKTQFAEQEPGKGCIFSYFLFMSKQRNNEKLILCRLQCVVVLSLVYVAYDTYYFLVAVATRMSSFPHQQGPQHRKGDQEFHLKKENKRFFFISNLAYHQFMPIASFHFQFKRKQTLSPMYSCVTQYGVLLTCR